MTIVRQQLDLSTVKIAALSDSRCLDDFCCGESEIDRNVRKCCGWDALHQARTYCATREGDAKACGFYTLSILPADSQHLEEDLTQGRIGNIPFIYLNYLGVQEHLQGNGLGPMMMGHALDNCAVVARTVGSFGVGLHALTERAKKMYYNAGFRAVEGASERMPFMVLPIRSLFDLVAIPKVAGETY